MTSDPVEALGGSVQRLRALMESMDGAAIEQVSYADGWTIAQVVSHLGSGAVIMERRLDDTLAGTETPEDFARSVWDRWDAKAPRDQVDDGLLADHRLLDRVRSLSSQQRAGLEFRFGPMTVDHRNLIVLRLNEHAVHTWDVEVAHDPTATIPVEAAAVLVDNLALMVSFAGRPTSERSTVDVRTTAPERTFRLDLGPESVSLTTIDDPIDADLTLPADAFIRLVYGRLDPAHTPTLDTRVDLDSLRRAFPGF